MVEDDAPAQVFDAGTHYIVSARSQAKVQEAIRKFAAQGGQLLAPMTQVGSKWVASVGNPKLAVQARVETLGFKRVITGPTLEAVRLKLEDLLERGAVLVQDAELNDGVWTAVCEKT
jgi:3-deoxy-D-manno-octulosonate 8-phosphate phosphatase KdsC-like HAD superfamily phosphatase